MHRRGVCLWLQVVEKVLHQLRVMAKHGATVAVAGHKVTVADSETRYWSMATCIVSRVCMHSVESVYALCRERLCIVSRECVHCVERVYTSRSSQLP